MKCIECVHCDKENLKCHPESMDCAKEYDLTKEDLYTENDCDFASKISDSPAWNYYIIESTKKRTIYIKTQENLARFANNRAFVEKLIQDGKVPEIKRPEDVTSVYEITKEEYLHSHI